MSYAYHPSTIPSNADSWDWMASTTLASYQKKLVDNIFDKTPLLDFLKTNLKTERGYSIVRPLMSKEAFSADVAAYDPFDSISPTEDTQGITAAEYRWRHYVGSLAISGEERHRNTSEAQVVNLLEAKTNQLAMTLASTFNSHAYADPSGGSKNINGLAAIVSASDPTRAALGGIAVASNAWWKAKEDTTTEPLTLADMSSIFNQCSLFGEAPDRIFTTQTLWEKYESLLQPQQRFEDPKTAEAGFRNLVFRGVPVVWDPDCTSTAMYFLNSKYIYPVVLDGVFMKTTPLFTRPDRDQENRYAQVISYFEIVTDNRRAHGKLTGKS